MIHKEINREKNNLGIYESTFVSQKICRDCGKTIKTGKILYYCYSGERKNCKIESLSPELQNILYELLKLNHSKKKVKGLEWKKRINQYLEGGLQSNFSLICNKLIIEGLIEKHQDYQKKSDWYVIPEGLKKKMLNYFPFFSKEQQRNIILEELQKEILNSPSGQLISLLTHQMNLLRTNCEEFQCATKITLKESFGDYSKYFKILLCLIHWNSIQGYISWRYLSAQTFSHKLLHPYSKIPSKDIEPYKVDIRKIIHQFYEIECEEFGLYDSLEYFSYYGDLVDENKHLQKKSCIPQRFSVLDFNSLTSFKSNCKKILFIENSAPFQYICMNFPQFRNILLVYISGNLSHFQQAVIRRIMNSCTFLSAYIWTDHDKGGINIAQTLITLVNKSVESIKIIHPPKEYLNGLEVFKKPLRKISLNKEDSTEIVQMKTLIQNYGIIEQEQYMNYILDQFIMKLKE